jgi:hypothetical protein
VNRTVLSCHCGKVEMEAVGLPVIVAACHCADCHEGSRRLEALPQAPPILDDYGGTPHVLYRRDRISYVHGQELLKRLKVDEDSPDRAYASCCNSYMFIDVGPRMPVLPISRGRFRGDVPVLEVRMNLKREPGKGNLPDDVPCSPSFPFKFVRRVLGAQLAIVFRR